MSSVAERSYRVSGKTASAGPEQAAGVIKIDGEHKIHVVSAEPAFADVLELAATMLNDRDSFSVRVVPPDAKPFSLHRDEIPRDSPEAAEAVLTMLRSDYDLTLTPM